MNSTLSPEQEVQFIIALEQSIRNITNTVVAFLCFLTYDWLICFPKEVQYIWRSKWSIPKFIYLFSRYSSIPFFAFIAFMFSTTATSFKLCLNYNRTFMAGLVISSTNATILQCLRLRALFPKNNLLMGTCYFCSIVVVGINIATGVVFVNADEPSDFPPHDTGCASLLFSNTDRILSLTSLSTYTALHGFFAALTIRQGVIFWRSHPRRSPLMTVLVRDGSLVFVLIFVTSAITMSVEFLPVQISYVSFITTLFAVCSNLVASCYLILGLRAVKGAFTSPSISLGSIRFRGNPWADRPVEGEHNMHEMQDFVRRRIEI